jgi:superfamily II DNA/RNA helicase
LEKIPNGNEDTKLNELFQILDKYEDTERILLFAQFKETVRYLKENLSNRYKKRRVRIVTGDLSVKQRKEILERFAPVAHDKTKVKRKNDIDILIATDCISEGQNLQDARLLINYDLYWTPLVLIQRVGRLDRPTREKRTFNVVNFYPGDKIFQEISSLLTKVEERQKIYEDFDSIQVVGDFDRDFRKEKLSDKELKFITEIYKGKDYDKVMEKYIPTSQHLVDLASAEESDKGAANRLPDGARSAMVKKEHGIYVLLKYNRKKYSLWRANGKETIECAPIHSNHEVLLPKIKASMKKPLGTLPEDFDDLVGELVKEWAESNDFTYDKVKIVFSEYLHGTGN